MVVPLKVNPPVQRDSTSADLTLCVDLDGTLILSDLLLESMVMLIKRQPLSLLFMPFWLLRGRAAFKAEIAMRVSLNPAVLPYNHALLRWLEGERASGRRLWMCTAAHERFANSIADYLKLFDGVLATTCIVNLAGEVKAAQIVERFGERGFDYCGNEWRDLAIWKRARGAIVVHRGDRLLREVTLHAPVLQAFRHRSNAIRALFRAMRPHQWAKNILVAVPMLAAHLAGDADRVWAALLGTMAFCLCASSVYVVNDLLDLEADRAHQRKCKRPFAAADLSLGTGLAMAPLLLVASALVASLLPLQFQIALAVYYALTLAYSFTLKGLVLIDVLTLACLYTLRIIAGTFAVGVELSFWLMWFSMFLFLSLAFVKRYAELDALRRQHRLIAAGRDYMVEDLPLLQSLGAAAGYLSVVVLALYINSPAVDTLYRQPTMIWLICVLLLFWISRVWVKTQRGEMHDDPVVFALKDWTSRVVGVLVAVMVALAI